MSCVKLFSKLRNPTVQRSVLIAIRSKSECSEASWVPQEVETHTGQKWDKDDYRLARFVDRPKHVNKQFAIDLIAQVPPKVCTERVVWCDGGDDHTGHPRVYINLDKPGCHTCGYCGLRYVREDPHGH